MTGTHHLAQINIAPLIAPLDDPKISEFVAQLEPINALADRSPGFVWRLQSEQGNATDLAYNDDPFIIINMSVWESTEALKEFVYRSQHPEVFRDRKKWFEKMSLPHYCLWWIPVGHRQRLSKGKTGWNATSVMVRHLNRSGLQSYTRLQWKL